MAFIKICGAAAEQGKDLDYIHALAEKINSNMSTIAVLSDLATHPSTGGVCGELGDDEMEICAGQHGEGGGITMPMATSKETIKILADKVVEAVKSGAIRSSLLWLVVMVVIKQEVTILILQRNCLKIP